MALQSTTLRPGYLVSLKTSLTGNVRYDKRTLETEHTTEEGASRAKWETTKIISDPEEHDRAEKARNKAGSVIRAVCIHSAFGLLCPDTDADKLEAAMIEARKIAADFNASAKLSHIGVYAICGKVAPDDEAAVRAINSEVRELMDTMTEGLERLDVDAIRRAASKAQELGAMLPTEVTARIQTAVDVARKAARKLVKAGEQAAMEVDRATIRKIQEQRTAFLDLDDPKDMDAIERPAEQGRAIDLEPVTVTLDAAPTQTSLLEF